MYKYRVFIDSEWHPDYEKYVNFEYAGEINPGFTFEHSEGEYRIEITSVENIFYAKESDSPSDSSGDMVMFCEGEVVKS